MNLMTGNLLIASSQVTDPVYAGGVCLVVHQDETNVIGVMLNRPLQPSPEAMAAMFGEADDLPKPTPTHHRFTDKQESKSTKLPAANDHGVPTIPLQVTSALHFGGPLSGPVVAIHQTSQYAEAETGNGIYVAAQKQHLENLVRQQTSPYRLIVGHLGWEWDQLDAEIDAGIWHILPATADAVFCSAQEMWPRVIRRATANSVARWMGVPDVSMASQLN